MGGVEGPRLAGNRPATCDGVDGRMDGGGGVDEIACVEVKRGRGYCVRRALGGKLTIPGEGFFTKRREKDED